MGAERLLTNTQHFFRLFFFSLLKWCKSDKLLCLQFPVCDKINNRRDVYINLNDLNFLRLKKLNNC